MTVLKKTVLITAMMLGLSLGLGACENTTDSESVTEELHRRQLQELKEDECEERRDSYRRMGKGSIANWSYESCMS